MGLVNYIEYYTHYHDYESCWIWFVNSNGNECRIYCMKGMEYKVSHVGKQHIHNHFTQQQWLECDSNNVKEAFAKFPEHRQVDWQ